MAQPFAPLCEAMSGLGILTAGAVPGSVDAWLELIDRVRARERLMLLMEDLHWADVGTLAVLSRLARGHDAHPVAVLATIRPIPQRPEVDVCLSSLSGFAFLLTLGALDGESVTQLVSRLIDSPPGDRLREEIGRAAGNPAMVLELVACMQADGAIHRGPTGPAELTGAGWIGPAASAVVGRLGFLTASARVLLAHCSILGARFSVTDLVAFTGRATAELMPQIEELSRTGLLVVVDDHLAFTHDLVREAVYREVPAPVRAAAHRDAALRLSEVCASPVVVAEHFLRSSRTGDFSAVDVRHEATGLVDDAGPVPQPGLLDVVPRGRLRAELVVPTDPGAAPRHAVAGHRLEPGVREDPRGVMTIGREEVEPAGDEEESSAEAETLLLLGTGLHDLVELSQYDAAATHAVELAGDQRQTYAMYPHATAAHAAYHHDRHDLADELLAAGLAAAQASGDGNGLQLLLVTGAVQHLARGDWVAALADSRASEILAREDRARVWVEPSLVCAHVALHQEGPTTARRHLEHAVQLGGGGSPTLEDDGIARLEMMIVERENAPDRSALLACELWTDLEERGLSLDQASLAPTIARLARDRGRSDVVESAVRFSETIELRHPGVPSLRSWAMRSRALAEADPDLALEGLREARCSLRRPDVAHAAAEAATLLAGAGRTVEARASAHEALDIWGELHAVAEVSWRRAQFRRVGIVTGVRGTRSRPKSGWDALTPTEVRIARLAAEGCSNSEIADLLVISHRTVQSHIGKVLAKLGISSRRELVRAASQGCLEQLGSPDRRWRPAEPAEPAASIT